MIYLVDGVWFDDFLKAVAAARQVPCDVVEAKTQQRRWTPCKPVSKAATLAYLGRKNAYEAQMRLNERLRKNI